MCGHVCGGPQVDVACLPLFVCTPLYILRQGLTLFGSLVGSLSLLPRVWDYRQAVMPTEFLYEFWDSSLKFIQQAFYLLSHFPNTGGVDFWC